MSKEEFQKCEHCRHDTFIKFYNVYNKKIKIDDKWQEIEMGVEKDHLHSVFCEKCRKEIEY